MLPSLKGVGDYARCTPWPSLDQVLQVGVVAEMTAAAAALLVTHQAPSHAAHSHKPVHSAPVGSTSDVLKTHHATLVAQLPLGA